MIFDSHLHVFLRDKNEDHNAVIDRLLSDVRMTGIDKAGVLISSGPSRKQEDAINVAKFSDELGKRFPGVFFPMICINQLLPVDFLKDIVRKYILNGNITGMKIVTQVNARDKILENFADFLQKYDIPILYHAWYKTVGKVGYESDPSDIVVLAKKFPSLRILMAHLTGCRFKGIQDIKPYPNISIDTSGSGPEDGYMEYALNELGADRIIFGTDHPGREVAAQLGRINSVDLSEVEKEKILHSNAINFFRKGELNA